MPLIEENTQNINSGGDQITPASDFTDDGHPGSCDEESELDRNFSEGQNHPLLNQVILRKVLDHVRRKDLLACRGVCKTWNVATIPYTRLAFEISIGGNQTIYSSYGLPGLYSKSELDAKDNNVRKVENFVELISSNKLGIPFGKYKLGAFSTTDGTGQIFLELCGDTITEVSFFNEDHKVEDVSELLKSTPKLQSFQVPTQISSKSGNSVSLFPDATPRLNYLKKILIYGDPTENCPTFFEEILGVAQNISDFTLLDGYSDNPEGNYKSLEVLRLIDNLGWTSSVQTLYFLLMRSEHVDILTAQRNRFNLKKLNYFSTAPGVDHMKLITFYRNTLRGLGISNMTTVDSFMGFPKMTQLKQMSLKFRKVLNSRCVNLNDMFPALETLHLSGKADEEHDHFFPDSNPCLTLKSLLLEKLHLKINGFKQIQIVFPNLTKLELIIYVDGPETLKQTWSQMTQLEDLKLNGGTTTMVDLDSLFTGISAEGIQEITRTGALKELELKTEGVRRETIRNLKNQYSQLPSITNLTKLRSVHLNLTGGSPGVIYDVPRHLLTDLTLYLGLYSMKTLKHVMVENCGFTKTGCKILTDEMGLVSWAFKSIEYERIRMYTSTYIVSGLEVIQHKYIL